MFPVRITTLVFILLLMTFTIRLGDFVMQVATGARPEITSSEALAEEKKEEAKPTATAVEPATQNPGGESAIKQEQPAEKVPQAGEDDPFMQEYSDEEVKVLQSLSKRREQLTQRERDLDQREKLLQAAEKKVDQKVAELAKMRTELEALMDKQQKVEEERVAQLVKIYENMKPKDAATIFNEMESGVLLSIFDKMSERKVAPIMAAMDPNRARAISSQLAAQRALPKASPPAMP